MKSLAALAALLVASSVSLVARADAPAPGVITLPTMVLVGRVQRPAVVVEISRAKMSLPLAEMQPPAALRADDAARRAP